ncbi:MAG: outer membrane beta-barrel protein [Desulfobacteraceae bacterium]|nr:outer membrane beta-barrel protein [Desulfobacteraceae bacterium]
MKKAAILAMVVLLLTGYGASVWAADFTGNVNVFVGKKYLDDDDWGDLDHQTELGLKVDFAQRRWPINIAIDLLGSSDSETIDGVNYEGKTTEFCVGVRKIFQVDKTGLFNPYIGGGLAFVRAELEQSYRSYYQSDDDTNLGIWLNGGIYFTLSQHFNIGLDLRYSKAEVTLFDTHGEAGGTHIGLILGYHW